MLESDWLLTSHYISTSLYNANLYNIVKSTCMANEIYKSVRDLVHKNETNSDTET